MGAAWGGGYNSTGKEPAIKTSAIDKPFLRPGTEQDLFCHDLPSTPQPALGRVLVTGASGYIGGRLVPELLARGYQVTVMVRAASPEYQQLWPDAEIVVADALDVDQLTRGLRQVDVAYYLIHSLLLGPQQFASADIEAAANFREAAEANQVKRIIYLGGLGDMAAGLSSHLQSRLDVAEELQAGTVPVTILRAAIIIGSGSASYEIINHLVRKLVAIPVPKWARNRCQPIAVRDVVKYLVGVLEMPETSGRSFDIGGPEVLTYEMMLKILADVLHKKRLFVPLPSSHIACFAYLTSLLTPVPAPITRCLMEGLTHDVVCQHDQIKQVLPIDPITYRQALVRAMTREQQDAVSTRWSDAYPPAHELAIKLHEVKGPAPYLALHAIDSEKSAADLFRSICTIGGKEGWLQSNWMWRLRGWIDRALLGVGSSRGRKSFSQLTINDVIDFWRIEDLQADKRLLLRAEMKMPGRAWLEFNVADTGRHRRLSITAHYYARGFFGRGYWYLFLPFHYLIFTGLIKQIEKRS